MPEMTGTVKCLQLQESAAFTTIEDGAGHKETFILWFGDIIPRDLTSFTRVVHSMWVSVLREAHSRGRTVTVMHPSSSAEITGLRLG